MNNKNVINHVCIAVLLICVLVFSGCTRSTPDEEMAQNKTSAQPQATPASFAAGPTEPWPRLTLPIAENPALDQRLDEIFLKLSLEEKIGQVIQAEIQSITPEQAKQYHIGSILNGGGSIPYRIENATTKDWLRMADAFYAASMDTSDGKVAIPIIWGTDAVHGHGNLTGATVFPHNIGLGAANNPELVRKIGEITAREVRATGIEWVFGPTIAVAQDDRWGRTYESYSEQGEIVASYARAMVEGMQGKHGTADFLDEKHVLATAKHFVGDGGTLNGDDQGNVIVTEQELSQLHAAGYRSALEAGVQSVMASFNSWHGEKIHGSEYLMSQVLKGRLGFAGFIVGDWNGHGQVPGCSNDSCVASLAAGLDMYMVPTDWKALYHNLLQQVRDGEVGIDRLNDAVKRILKVKLRMGLFDAPKPSERFFAKQANIVGSAEHRAVARQAVRESLVLLKNKGKVLPLSPKLNVLVAGDGVNDLGKQSGGWTIGWQGFARANEKFKGATSIFSGIESVVTRAGGRVRYSAAAEFKEKPDVAIVVFGEDPYAEGMGDLNSLEYQMGDKRDLALLKRIKAAGIPVVSIFISGRPLWVNPELNASDAFVAAWLPGSEGAGVADVLFKDPDGKIRYDFSGRLSFSWPDLPTQAQLNPHHKDYKPLFAYGYGLDYSTNNKGPGTLSEAGVGASQALQDKIRFYAGKPIEPWRVFIRSKDRRQFMSGGYSALPGGNIKVASFDKDVQHDALLFEFNNVPEAWLTVEDGVPMDLSSIAEVDGVLAMDIQNMSPRGAQLELVMSCGTDCELTVPVSQHLASIADRGWQRLEVSLSCFSGDLERFASVSRPFALRASGSGKIGVANIEFSRQVTGNPCPD